MRNIQEAVAFSEYGQRSVAMAALSVRSLPDYRLLCERDEEAVERVKHLFATLINGFAAYKTDNSISLELVWSCSPAENQPFTSYVELQLIFRAVDINRQAAFGTLQKIATDAVNALGGLKIVSEFCAVDKYNAVIAEATRDRIWAVRRRDDAVSFSLPMFPYCYKYDAVAPLEADLDGLVNTLINQRGSAVIIQLISTCFNDQERNYIAGCINSLGQIEHGIPMGQMGFYRDPLAEVPLRTYRRYYEYFNSPLVAMNMLVCGSAQNVPNLSSALVSLLNDSNGEQQTACEVVDISSGASVLRNTFVSPWTVLDGLYQANRNPQLLSSPIGGAIYRLAGLYTAAEASQVFRMPIGTRRVTAGITIHELEKRHKRFASGIINVADLPIGRLQNVIGSEDAYVGINAKDLTRHMLVVGTPGSGKSTFLVGLMDQLWKKLGIPFLVIEPAKYEYRALIDSIPDLQVFSPGKNRVAPFVMNPFMPPKGVTVEKYKSIVKSAFSAAFEMWTPLDQLFDETLNICYSEQGWLDSTTPAEGDECFSLIDFIATYKEVVGSKGYTGEYKKQIEAAGVLRLNGLLEQNANIFDSRHSVPIEDILKKPTVIELSNIKDVKQKSFLIALLLNNIYAYVEENLRNDGELKNVILLEEAHALLCSDMVTSAEGSGNANMAAVKLLTDMLAEIRSRGVGIVVADQSPKKVTSPVIANTNVKVVFRLAELTDQQIVRGSTVMTELQQSRLPNLKCGQAMLYFDKLDEVEQVQMDDYRLNNGITTDLSDEAIRDRMTYWQTRQHLLKPYPDCDSLAPCEGGCDFTVRESARVVADRIFRKYYPAKFNDINSFANFYKRIGSIVAEETEAIFRDAAMAERIGHCVRVQLLRKVHYHAGISLPLPKRVKIYATMRRAETDSAPQGE